MNKVLGITNDVTTCECCGRSNLKATIIIGNEDGTVLGYFGSNCARAYVRGTAVSIERSAMHITQRAREEARIAAAISREINPLMTLERSEINYELHQRLGSHWNVLGLDRKMTPEQRREIYVDWMKRRIYQGLI